MKIDELEVLIFDTREEMGSAAGEAVIARLRELLDTKKEVNVIFAAAPSQLELLDTLRAGSGIAWERVNAFHMDEYIGLPRDAPQRFGNFLDRHLFDRLPFKQVNYLSAGDKTPEEASADYAALLQAYPPDMVCMGIGENGHIAFNDPPVADFNDSELVKMVELDAACRQQQVNDECFDTLDKVPLYALTLTVPALMSADYVYCVVPGKQKAKAIRDTLYGPISTDCPASILRTHPNAKLFVDQESFSRS